MAGVLAGAGGLAGLGLTTWSLLTRIALRRGLLLPDAPRLLLLASDEEMAVILQAWARVPSRQRLQPVPPWLEQLLKEGEHRYLWLSLPSAATIPTFLTLSSSSRYRTRFWYGQFQLLVCLNSNRNVFRLLADSGCSYDELPWAAPFSVQAQLKRLADLFVAVALLLLTSPFVGLAALMIWLEDQGSVFYCQQRSGWLGRPFLLFSSSVR